MITLRTLLPLALLVLATFLTTFANAKGPAITNKVYFDIEQDGEKLGRGQYMNPPSQFSSISCTDPRFTF